MPRLYEEAAILLYYVVGRGAVLNRWCDLHKIVTVLAETLEDISLRQHTHAEAAAVILDTLQKHWFVIYDPAQRDRLIAVIGTVIGNTPSLQLLKC